MVCYFVPLAWSRPPGAVRVIMMPFPLARPGPSRVVLSTLALFSLPLARPRPSRVQRALAVLPSPARSLPPGAVRVIGLLFSLVRLCLSLAVRGIMVCYFVPLAWSRPPGAVRVIMMPFPLARPGPSRVVLSTLALLLSPLARSPPQGAVRVIAVLSSLTQLRLLRAVLSTVAISFLHRVQRGPLPTNRNVMVLPLPHARLRPSLTARVLAALSLLARHRPPRMTYGGALISATARPTLRLAPLPPACPHGRSAQAHHHP